VIRKEAWSFYRTTSGVRLCWKLEEPKGPKGPRRRARPPSRFKGLCLGFGIDGWGVQDLELKVVGARLRHVGAGFRVQGAGVLGAGFRVLG
jgi:hypothetical protein